MGGADPNYDLRGGLETLAPGYNIQQEMLDAAWATYAANNYQPLSAAQAQAACLAGAQLIAAEGTDPALPGVPWPAVPPAQPIILTTADAPPVTYAFAKGLPRFADSNPATNDGWAIDNRACL